MEIKYVGTLPTSSVRATNGEVKEQIITKPTI